MIYKLGDLIAINPKISLSKGKKARKIAMEDITPFTRDIGSYSFTEYKGGTKFQNGDTLLVRITPCLENGKTAFVNILKDDEVAFGSTEYFVLRAKEKVMDPYYLYYLVTTSAFRKVAIKSMTGTSGRQRAQKEAIENFNLDLPSLIEQKRIAYKLKILDDKIALNKQINANLLKLAKEVYLKILASSDLVETRLKDFATITMGQSPSSKTYNENGVGMALLNGAADFRNGIHPSKWTTDAKRIVDKGAYIFGVRATIGLTTKVFNKYAIGRGTGSAVVQDTVNDEFLYFVLDDMFKYFTNTGSGSVYINISKSDFNDYIFRKPQGSDLQTFHQIVSPMMSKIYANKKENLALNQLKEILLNRFF